MTKFPWRLDVKKKKSQMARKTLENQVRTSCATLDFAGLDATDVGGLDCGAGEGEKARFVGGGCFKTRLFSVCGEPEECEGMVNGLVRE